MCMFNLAASTFSGRATPSEQELMLMERPQMLEGELHWLHCGPNERYRRLASPFRAVKSQSKQFENESKYPFMLRIPLLVGMQYTA